MKWILKKQEMCYCSIFRQISKASTIYLCFWHDNLTAALLGIAAAINTVSISKLELTILRNSCLWATTAVAIDVCQ